MEKINLLDIVRVYITGMKELKDFLVLEFIGTMADGYETDDLTIKIPTKTITLDEYPGYRTEEMPETPEEKHIWDLANDYWASEAERASERQYGDRD